MRIARLVIGVLGLSTALASVARADVKLPAIFGDNMVLQADKKLPVWGWASPGEDVTVSLGDQ
jgi:sialate O-acetylesterase